MGAVGQREGAQLQALAGTDILGVKFTQARHREGFAADQAGGAFAARARRGGKRQRQPGGVQPAGGIDAQGGVVGATGDEVEPAFLNREAAVGVGDDRPQLG